MNLSRFWLAPLVAGLFLGLFSAAPASALSPVIPDGEALTRDGEPIRFWGINVNLQPWNTHASIDSMVARIKEVGFNAVRLWPNWKSLYGTDVRWSIESPPQGFSLHPYQQGDGSQLDLFDYMVHRCRENGLAVYMTALMYYPPYYTEPEFADLVTTDPDDRAAWIEAMGGPRWHKGIYDPWWGLQYLDERIQAIWLKHAELFLNHVNPYTGLRNADDNNIAMWQLMNESKFLRNFMLKNEYRRPKSNGRAFAPYFQDKLRVKFNDFLRDRYINDAGLAAAWGDELSEGESLTDDSVDAGVKDPDNVAYGPKRSKDFTAFAIDLVKSWNRQLLDHVRGFSQSGSAAVSPIATDTFGWTEPPHLSTMLDGSMLAFGQYPDPQYRGDSSVGFKLEGPHPWIPQLLNTGAWGPYDLARPADRPAVIYEANYNSYALFDADLPWLLSTFASWQNINGVFYYFWNAPRTSDLPDPYGENRFADRGMEIWGDEVLVSAIQTAGEAFLKGLLPTAGTPTLFSLSDEAAADPAWGIWSYRGSDPLVPLQGIEYWQARKLRHYLAGTTFARGSRVTVDPDQTEDLIVNGPLDAVRLREDFQFGEGVQWNGTTGTLIIDLPKIKAFVGPPDGSSIQWSGGFGLEAIDTDRLGEGDLHLPNVAAALISQDDNPLEVSERIRMSAVAHSYHEGLSWEVGTRATPGTGPVTIRRPGGTLVLPAQPGREAALRNFAFEELEIREAETGLTLSHEAPVYDVILSVPPEEPPTLEELIAQFRKSVAKSRKLLRKGRLLSKQERRQVRKELRTAFIELIRHKRLLKKAKAAKKAEKRARKKLKKARKAARAQPVSWNR